MKTVSLFAVLFVLAFAHVAKADDLFNNLSATPSGIFSISNSFLTPSFTLQPLAASFSTGASAFDFNSLTVALSGTPQIADVFLLSDASNSPGAVLGGFTDALPLAPTVSDIPFPQPFSFTLAPNTRYWIELSLATNAYWSVTLDTSGIGVAGEFTASQFSLPSPTWLVVPNTVGPYQMEVAGTTVPEPPSVILLATGLAALFAFMRERNAFTASLKI